MGSIDTKYFFFTVFNYDKISVLLSVEFVLFFYVRRFEFILPKIKQKHNKRIQNIWKKTPCLPVYPRWNFTTSITDTVWPSTRWIWGHVVSTLFVSTGCRRSGVTEVRVGVTTLGPVWEVPRREAVTGPFQSDVSHSERWVSSWGAYPSKKRPLGTTYCSWTSPWVPFVEIIRL